MGDTAPEIAELGLGYADLEDQQRDRDREHAVAERLDSPSVPAISHDEPASTAPQPILLAFRGPACVTSAPLHACSSSSFTSE